MVPDRWHLLQLQLYTLKLHSLLIFHDYEKGKLLTGEVKKRLIEVVTEYITDFQAKRAKVTDADVEKFMKVRPIDANPKAWKAELEKRAAERAAQEAAKKKAKEEAK